MFFKLLICWIMQNNTNPSKCKLQFSQILGDVKGLIYFAFQSLCTLLIRNTIIWNLHVKGNKFKEIALLETNSLVRIICNSGDFVTANNQELGKLFLLIAAKHHRNYV